MGISESPHSTANLSPVVLAVRSTDATLTTIMQRSIPFGLSLIVGLLVCIVPFTAAFAVPWTTDYNQFSTAQQPTNPATRSPRDQSIHHYQLRFLQNMEGMLFFGSI